MSTLSIDHVEALSWLQNRRLLFIGDSITRYQYLNLVYFLATGSFKSPIPQNENEKQWWAQGNWTGFYIGTTERLRSKTHGGGAICDCYRGPTSPESVENRYCMDAVWNISVSFVALTQPPVKGHNFDWLAGGCKSWPCKQTGCAVGICARPWDFELDSPKSILVHLAKMLRADTVIYSSGWTQYADHPELVNSLIEGGDEAMALGVRHLYWKTTTDCLGTRAPMEHQIVVPRLQNANWTVFDAYNLTTSLARMATNETRANICWDALHPTQAVHSALNEVLLRQLAAE